jgi:murein DD-endopeptidase MepM/ murein hydrolase activator NlpD
MVVTDTAGQPRSMRVPVWLLKALVVFIVVVVVVVAYGALTYTQLLSKAVLVDDLQTENRILRDYTERVHSLERDLATNRILLEKMMELAGIDASPEFMSSDSSDAVTSGAVPDYSSQVFRQQYAGDNVELDSMGGSTPDGIPILGSVSRVFAPGESEGVRRHLGMDIAAREGTPVYATAGGVVEFADWDESFGNYLIMDHIDGYKTHYGHNRALLVSVGDVVRRGELVALSGNTGRSSAPHLHYEIRHNGEPVDPANFMDVESLKQVE